ncbi:MAG: methionyl-tRNA formyltransferase [Planctomycetota bacterium]|jgi:methionyl-tRNA formyltransferase
MRIVFLGTPDAAVPTLRRVVEEGFTVALVVTRPDRRRGRGRETSPSPVKAAAAELGLPVFQPEDVNDDESLARIQDVSPDLLLIVAFGRILKKPLLAAPRIMPVNLHFSLLPEYRGAAPVAKAIAEGREETGVTLQRIVRKLDAGPVLSVVPAEIGPEETAGELEARLAVIGADLTARTLTEIAAGEVEERPQDEERATYAPMLKKEDGQVDWTLSAREIFCHVRAMNPWPGAQTTFAGEARGKAVRATLLRARPGPLEDSGLTPGEVTAVGAEGVLVQTGEGQLAVLELKPEGKRLLAAQEFVNGYRAQRGDLFRADP